MSMRYLSDFLGWIFLSLTAVSATAAQAATVSVGYNAFGGFEVVNQQSVGDGESGLATANAPIGLGQMGYDILFLGTGGSVTSPLTTGSLLPGDSASVGWTAFADDIIQGTFTWEGSLVESLLQSTAGIDRSMWDALDSGSQISAVDTLLDSLAASGATGSFFANTCTSGCATTGSGGTGTPPVPAVPLPAGAVLLLTGLGAFGLRRKRH